MAIASPTPGDIYTFEVTGEEELLEVDDPGGGVLFAMFYYDVTNLFELPAGWRILHESTLNGAGHLVCLTAPSSVVTRGNVTWNLTRVAGEVPAIVSILSFPDPVDILEVAVGPYDDSNPTNPTSPSIPLTGRGYNTYVISGVGGYGDYSSIVAPYTSDFQAYYWYQAFFIHGSSFFGYMVPEMAGQTGTFAWTKVGSGSMLEYAGFTVALVSRTPVFPFAPKVKVGGLVKEGSLAVKIGGVKTPIVRGAVKQSGTIVPLT